MRRFLFVVVSFVVVGCGPVNLPNGSKCGDSDECQSEYCETTCSGTGSSKVCTSVCKDRCIKNGNACGPVGQAGGCCSGKCGQTGTCSAF